MMNIIYKDKIFKPQTKGYKKQNPNIKKTLKRKKKSFKPYINKSLKTIYEPPQKFELCSDNMLEVKINHRCYKYNQTILKKFLIDNLNKNKLIDCNNVIAPKQSSSNCWFNTMFMSIFISDKGRKFFKFFRKLMILGKTRDGNIFDKQLAKAFFILNLSIEACYNPLLKDFAYKFDSNLIIKSIYNYLKKNNPNFLKKNSNIYNINKPGNPIEYYFSLFNFLNTKQLKIKVLSDGFEYLKYLKNKLKFDPNFIIERNYDIIILELNEYDSGKSKHLKDFEFKGLKYKLDSCIIRDVNKQHFSSLLKCDKEQYSFDGASYARLSKFKWMNYLNKNINWGFKGHDLKFNFKNGYQLLFYYREN